MVRRTATSNATAGQIAFSWVLAKFDSGMGCYSRIYLELPGLLDARYRDQDDVVGGPNSPWRTHRLLERSRVHQRF